MALSLASSSADSGSAYGQYVLGAMHFNGDCGFAANDAKAAELWHLAAEQGHIASADWLSVLCASSYLILRILLSHSSFIRSLVSFIIHSTCTAKAGAWGKIFTRSTFCFLQCFYPHNRLQAQAWNSIAVSAGLAGAQLFSQSLSARSRTPSPPP